MTTLILVRHGETDWNAARRIQGSTDIALNDTGRAQARELAERLRGELAGAGRLVVSASDLSRAAETAQIIAARLGVDPPRTYRQLRERSYGIAEGVSVDEMRRRWGSWADADIPEAESWPDVRRRALAGLQRAVRDARRETAPSGPTVIVVTHGALIREVIRHASSGAFPHEGERLANASTHTFLLERDRLSVRSYAAVPLA
ncbi:histidine phosphatase family protein [Microbacterium sp. VKM Ac-2870]|uniref:histidine phosphatase family protein n=1 Tax=Microbacterium sp. VKM Ac-2870 TaxID=2783825 RepID=UPI00188AF71E|nr:histidine phosphatase family protein [Microbacterium sp. VKM Ac-2870]MBF4561006.1 histidine phosphatase family protein [Microbacterium sp. VKM Ac-2870]